MTSVTYKSIYNNILPGGRIYQKAGSRLENAIYKNLPGILKQNISRNHKIKKSNGDILVEYDLLYQYKNHIISFEIKGINSNVINNENYQDKLFSQAKRQIKYLDLIAPDKKKLCIFCLITDNNTVINPKLIIELNKVNIMIGIGNTPANCVKQIYSILTKNKLLN